MATDSDADVGSQSQVTRSKFWRLERFWIVANLTYSGLRVLLAWRFLANHGLNLWGFAAVEVISAIPWAIGTSRLTKALVTRSFSGAWKWATLAAASFLAPDVYVVSTTHRVPTWIYLVIAGWLVIAAILSVRRVVVSVAERRAVDVGPRRPPTS